MSSFTEGLEYQTTSMKDSYSGLPLYLVTKGFQFDVGRKGNTFSIVVPEGFLSDFATIPWPLRIWFKPTDSRWAKAALVHDRVINEQLYSRAMADLIFLEGMLILGAGWKAYLFYAGVHAFGLWRSLLKKPYYTVID